MIFVTLGTQDKQFKRLLDYCEALKTDEKIIVQAGLTEYHSDKMDIRSFIDQEDFEKFIAEADVLITHGGVGTIINALNQNKVVIACPRLSKYHEHHNDHQVEIVDEFERRGLILALRENDDLAEVLEKAKIFKPGKYISNTANFVQKLDEYLGSL